MRDGVDNVHQVFGEGQTLQTSEYAKDSQCQQLLLAGQRGQHLNAVDREHLEHEQELAHVATEHGGPVVHGVLTERVVDHVHGELVSHLESCCCVLAFGQSACVSHAERSQTCCTAAVLLGVVEQRHPRLGSSLRGTRAEFAPRRTQQRVGQRSLHSAAADFLLHEPGLSLGEPRCFELGRVGQHVVPELDLALPKALRGTDGAADLHR